MHQSLGERESVSVLTVRETGITTHRAVGDPPSPSNIEVLFEYDGYEVVKRVALQVPDDAQLRGARVGRPPRLDLESRARLVNGVNAFIGSRLLLKA